MSDLKPNEKYVYLMWVIHSALESSKDELIFNETTTVENFRDNKINKAKCDALHEYTLKELNY